MRDALAPFGRPLASIKRDEVAQTNAPAQPQPPVTRETQQDGPQRQGAKARRHSKELALAASPETPNGSANEAQMAESMWGALLKTASDL
jgi:hypothetical protein